MSSAGSVTLWMPAVEPDGSQWLVITSATLQAGPPGKERVTVYDRHGLAAGDIELPAGDGEALLRRLGMEPVP